MWQWFACMKLIMNCDAIQFDLLIIPCFCFIITFYAFNYLQESLEKKKIINKLKYSNSTLIEKESQILVRRMMPLSGVGECGTKVLATWCQHIASKAMYHSQHLRILMTYTFWFRVEKGSLTCSGDIICIRRLNNLKFPIRPKGNHRPPQSGLNLQSHTQRPTRCLLIEVKKTR